MLRKTSVALALMTAVALAGPASAATAADGSSTPVKDGYYPSAGSARVDVLSYNLNLAWRPGEHRLYGTATLYLRPTVSDTSFPLTLGQSMHVTGITFDNDNDPTTPAVATKFAHAGKLLTVKHRVTADTPVTVTITYKGLPQAVAAPTSRKDTTSLGWHTLKSGQTWTTQEPYGAYTWYPVNDNPSDKALYTVRISAPKGMVGVSNGQLTSRVTSTKTGRTTTVFDDTAHPMAPYLLTVAIGDYRHYTGTAAGVPLSVWVPRSHAGYSTPLMATGDAMKFLVDKLGPYPFDRVGVVVTPGSSTVETQTMITLGSGNYRYGNTSVRQTVAHALAHAWYGDTVTPYDWHDLWMNEGFATYLEAQYAVSKGWSSWSGWVQEWRQNDGYWRSLYGPPGNYDRNQFGQTNIYNCTALMLTRLRGKIGSTAFDSALKDWPQEHLDTNAKRSTYVNWLEQRTGMELSPFFDTWLNSKTSPA